MEDLLGRRRWLRLQSNADETSRQTSVAAPGETEESPPSGLDAGSSLALGSRHPIIDLRTDKIISALHRDYKTR
tara:strand:+ start:243 stop:464 length:222 start_codon:yes stop_codon:yes gene_type:complete